MTGTLAIDYAARRLGWSAGEVQLAVLRGHVATVPGEGPAAPRRLAALEVSRLEGSEVPTGSVVGAASGADLLGVPVSRFAALARAGCVRPVQVRLTRYRSVMWLYARSELEEFAEERPALLAGRLPVALRDAVAAGADLRARHWRKRRVDWAVAQASDPWARAAARALSLRPAALAAAVPDAAERDGLLRRRPSVPLAVDRGASVMAVGLLNLLGSAEAEDEVRHFRLLLDADLAVARARTPESVGGCRPPVRSLRRRRVVAGGRADSRRPAAHPGGGVAPQREPRTSSGRRS